MRPIVIRSLALLAALTLAGCASSRNDGWSVPMNAAVIGHVRTVNGIASK